MALPSSGSSISISQIRDELIANGSSYSLRQLSAWAGKSTPDAMSEFYGYSAVVPSYTYNIVAYSGYVTVSGTYTTSSGASSSFSFYNYSASGGVVGSVCAKLNTVNVTSGNGTKTQGSTC
jgi:hypothetical protein